MMTRLLTLYVLITTFSYFTDKEEEALYDPVLIYRDLTVDKLEESGFEKISENSKTFYQDKDQFRKFDMKLLMMKSAIENLGYSIKTSKNF